MLCIAMVDFTCEAGGHSSMTCRCLKACCWLGLLFCVCCRLSKFCWDCLNYWGDSAKFLVESLDFLVGGPGIGMMSDQRRGPLRSSGNSGAGPVTYAITGIAYFFTINSCSGYMSPEYARYGHFSEKLNVFSFGVLLLEIVSGKRNAAFYHFEHSPTLAGWAWELWKEGRGMEVIDASVRATCPPDEALKCIHVGFLCVQEAPADRPTMASVIRMLQSNEATSLPPSKEPAFSTNRNSIPVVGSSQLPAVFSNNGVTISLPEGR